MSDVSILKPLDTIDDELPSALHEALGQVLAEERREWGREGELIQAQAQAVEAQAQAMIAELRAQAAEWRSEFAAMVNARLAELKNGAPGVDGPPGPRGEPGPAGKDGSRGPHGAAV